MTNPNTLAVFDFDNTLVEGDSLWPFLCYACGTVTAVIAAIRVSQDLFQQCLKNKKSAEVKDIRTQFKARLVKKLLAGKKPEDIASAAAKLRKWVKWIPRWRQALLDHHAAGHHIVIASGALDIYLSIILGDLPYTALVCTKMEAADGALTGAMLSGNCVRARKAEMVKDYIASHGPFGESWGYGNYPHDVPMLELMKHRVIA